MLARKPLTLTPDELTKLKQVTDPYVERISHLQEDLVSTRTIFESILAAFLTGRGLEGSWNIDLITGTIQPLPLLGANGAREPMSQS